MASVPLTFLFVALVILLGFVTSRVFQVTRFPDIPLLMCLGLVLGPLNRAAGAAGSALHSDFLATSFDEATFKQLAPFFSQLALIVILFDSGLKLDMEHVAKGLRPAAVHTVPLMILTVTGISLLAKFVWGMPTIVAVVLGVALSNVGQTVSAFLVREINIPSSTKSIYFIEMAIYDVISIPLLVGLLELAEAGSADLTVFSQGIARVASVSVMFGLVGGLIWIYVLLRLENYPYTYMVTLATLLLVYSLNSFAGGSGAISALIFGLVVGNRNSILKMFNKRVRIEDEGARVHTFHDEITFFIRSFFFVFLGIIFSTGQRGEAGQSIWNVSSPFWPFSAFNGTATLFLLGCLLIFTAIVLIRYVSVRYISARQNPEHLSLWVIFGRGLGTAVLCTFPFTIAAYADTTSAYYRMLAPFEGIFYNAALMIILLTVVGTSATVMYEESRLRRIERSRVGRPAATAKE